MRIRDSRSGLFRARRPGIQLISSAAALAGLACLVFLPVSHGQLLQQEQPIHNPSGLPPPNPLANPKPDPNQIMEYEMQRRGLLQRYEKLNTLRQKEMTDDTARLLALAREVREKTTADPNSVTAIELQKIEAIEKLARSVREKMEFTLTQ
ncbi:MAG TPA: hypothetical protein VIM62_01890 [Acidobacteriaceae bacterium]